MSVFHPSRWQRRRSLSSPASSGAGCDCGRKTWWPSSLSGCSPAGGRAQGSAHSLPSQALAVPWGSSSGESPLLHALPLTRDASARHASLHNRGESHISIYKIKPILRIMLTWFGWIASPLMRIGYCWANWRWNGWPLLPRRSTRPFLLHNHLSFLLHFLLHLLSLRILWKGIGWIARHHCRTENKCSLTQIKWYFHRFNIYQSVD